MTAFSSFDRSEQGRLELAAEAVSSWSMVQVETNYAIKTLILCDLCIIVFLNLQIFANLKIPPER
jgi:hypothetical protein